MEGRLTNLEQHQVRTGSKTVTAEFALMGRSLRCTLPPNVIAYGLTSIDYAGDGSGFRTRKENNDVIATSTGNTNIRSITVSYAYYA